jgi:hypothetical protein
MPLCEFIVMVLPAIVVPVRLPPSSSMPLVLSVMVSPSMVLPVEPPRNFRPLSKCVSVRLRDRSRVERRDASALDHAQSCVRQECA